MKGVYVVAFLLYKDSCRGAILAGRGVSREVWREMLTVLGSKTTSEPP